MSLESNTNYHDLMTFTPDSARPYAEDPYVESIGQEFIISSADDQKSY